MGEQLVSGGAGELGVPCAPAPPRPLVGHLSQGPVAGNPSSSMPSPGDGDDPTSGVRIL